MSAWLLTWNPTRIGAEEAGLRAACHALHLGEELLVSDWSVGGRRHIAAEDRLYLMRVGVAPLQRGIVAVAEALGPPVAREHWSGEAGRWAWYVPLVWLVCHPYGAPLVRQGGLKAAFPGVCFSPQSSGMRLRADEAEFIAVRCGLGSPVSTAHGPSSPLGEVKP